MFYVGERAFFIGHPTASGYEKFLQHRFRGVLPACWKNISKHILNLRIKKYSKQRKKYFEDR